MNELERLGVVMGDDASSEYRQSPDRAPGEYVISYKTPAWYATDESLAPPTALSGLPPWNELTDPPEQRQDDSRSPEELIRGDRLPPQGVRVVPPTQVPRRTPPRRRSASFAARLAGRRRLHLRDEWAALLAGEDGQGLPREARRRMLSGFLLAALRMRAHDFLGFLWSPVDWLLSTAARGQAVTASAVGALAVYIQATDGLHTLLTEGWAWCAGCGVAVRMGLVWLRRVRGIELANVRAGGE